MSSPVAGGWRVSSYFACSSWISSSSKIAYANSFGQYYAAAGWAQFDRHFAVWAECEGFTLDLISQTDLHYRPELLDESLRGHYRS